jgi:hypothetical protein
MRVRPQSRRRSTLTTEPRRAAGRDRADHAPFDAPETPGVRFVGLAMAAKDVGQFAARPPAYRGGVTFSASLSKGLAVSAMSRVETRV